MTTPTEPDWLHELLEQFDIGNITYLEIEAAINDRITEVVRDKLKQLLDTQLPWPKKIFGEVSEDDWPRINEFAKTELGYPVDRISATLMRDGWECMLHVIRERLEGME